MELQGLQNQTALLEKKFADLNNKLDQIMNVLVGNVLDKEDHGFIGAVTALEKRVKSLEKWKDRIFWIMVGMGLPAGVGIWEMISSVIKAK